MIIIEGSDASGKSTLVHKIAQEIEGLNILSSEGPPEDRASALQSWHSRFTQHQGTKTILDRAAPISERIYGPILRGVNLFREVWPISDLVANSVPIIYCRPPSYVLLDPRMHVARAVENPEHIKQVGINQAEIMAAYDQVMAGVPHIEYDWTQSSERYWQVMVAWLKLHFQHCADSGSKI